MFERGLAGAWRRSLALSLACGILLGGLSATATATQSGNGLYSPFPRSSKHAGFFARVKIRITPNELAQGKFLMARNVAPGLTLHPVPPGGPSARAGVDDPRAVGTGGWLLGVGAVALVAGLGAATPLYVRRWRAAE